MTHTYDTYTGSQGYPEARFPVHPSQTLSISLRLCAYANLHEEWRAHGIQRISYRCRAKLCATYIRITLSLNWSLI
eukprot:1344619-Amorphochlora_amoeboformis.AAC.1